MEHRAEPLFSISLKVDISVQWFLLAFLSSEIGSEKKMFRSPNKKTDYLS